MLSHKLSKEYTTDRYLDRLIKRYKATKEVRSIDLETTGLDPYIDSNIVFSYSIGYQGGKTEVNRVDHKDYRVNIDNWEKLRKFFKNTSIGKTVHSLKFELSFLAKHNIQIPPDTVLHCTLLMSQLLRNNAASHALDRLCWELTRGEYKMDIDAEVKMMSKAVGNYQNIPKYLMDPYQRRDAYRGILLYDLFFPEILKNENLLRDYINEIELIKATCIMERHGITLDREKTEELLKWLQEELDKVDNETYKILKEDANLNSPIDVIDILFRKLEFPVISFTGKSRQPSVDKEVIMQLREHYNHPILDLILKKRSYTSGLAHIQSYKKFAGKSGIIHSHIKTNHAITGRQAPEKPNLANVAKEEVLKNPFPVPARKCFRPPLGHVLYLVDYVGIQMRLIIDTVNESYMMDLLRRGGDPHIVATECFYGKIYLNANSNRKVILRGAGKNGHFGIAFGVGLPKFATTINLKVIEAKPGYESYKRRFPRIANFANSIVSQVKEKGYVLSPFGRKLYVNPSKAYMGANYLIQHIEAMIVKRAQVRLHRYFRDCWDSRLQMVIPIHDELIISCPKSLRKYEKIYLSHMSSIMTSIKEITVALDVEFKVTETNWNDAVEIII